MATAAQWIEGARLRTLPAAVSPVLAGTGAAAAVDDAHLGRALLALVVGLALQVGVNYANDYSDGIRGTDADRVGPFRLVGSAAARPSTVRAAAWASFATAAVSGLALVAWSQHWWLLAVGAASIAAAWFYTGGDRPYGYRGLGEVSVFVFFGLVAVTGTTYVQAGRITAVSVATAVAVGCLACALMLVNNLRDVHTDAAGGKRTLAVFLGEQRSRLLYLTLLAVPFVVAAGLAVLDGPWIALALVCVPLAVATARPVARKATGAALIPSLRMTGLTELAFAALLTVGLALS
ncbi:1,4-dihydroxy-2-naphthoate prenyltransferase [Haloactinopolyspora alba]|uniref:1,4-dihydroxy-2-naphthoate octaprenyltransferase n=1 Tax=Haloactinopolyspora alba TaxID=648780 RepID=A0A2P8DGQ9_9ACTN|nr:1,4-dihydroxy-2-naphthoate polyprenyltransferase [Haloactinopolyspora alba]PSK96369.1 1,4-dihydroxy-2-naphthoate prenyltransferase [Haloactinopolyspora alba]